MVQRYFYMTIWLPQTESTSQGRIGRAEELFKKFQITWLDIIEMDFLLLVESSEEKVAILFYFRF